MKRIFAAMALAAMAYASQATPLAFASDDAKPGFGQAGLLSNKNRGDIPKLTLSAGAPLLAGAEDANTIELKSGTYYELEIEADGSQELALVGSGFFRAIWVDEVVIEGIEIRPFGIESLEFDEAGEVEISFVAIKPGSYFLGVPGSTLQRVKIVIK